MTDPAPPIPESASADFVAMFPTLTTAQLARVAAHGRLRTVQRGDVLIEQGDTNVPLFVVTFGAIEVVRPVGDTEAPIAVHGPGKFTGEVNMLSGRRALVRVRAGAPGEVIELSRDRLLGLVQTDTELSQLFLRAFILRRVELIARGIGDAVLVGSTHSPGTLRIKEFLTRNGHPYGYLDLDRDPDVQGLLDRFQVASRTYRC